MRIEFWADVTCPWAFVAKRRLDAAIAGGAEVAEAAEAAEVVWRPFRIDPTASGVGEPLDDDLRDPVVGMELRRVPGLAAPERVYLRMSDVAAEAGIEGGWRPAWRVATGDAQRLLYLAYEQGGAALQSAVAERLFVAYFIDGLDIGSSEVLATSAAAAGFPEGAKLLATGAGEAEVRELMLIGKARGVATSPTLFAGDRELSGARSDAEIAEFLKNASSDGDARRRPEEVERLRWADALLEAGDSLGALTLIAPLAAEHGQDPNVRRVLAAGYFGSAQLGKAREVLEAMVAGDPGDSYARMLLGRTLKRMGLAEVAAGQLRIAGAMTPDYA